ALGEGQLDVALVCLTGADDPVVRPHWDPQRVGWLSPLQLLDHIRVALLDESPDASESLAPPVAQLFDPGLHQPGGRLRARLRRGGLRRWLLLGVPLLDHWSLPSHEANDTGIQRRAQPGPSATIPG